MKVFGLTGGIGMGKSTAGKLLQEWGVPVVDTDVLARLVVELGSLHWPKSNVSSGREMIGPDGRLLRAKLAQLVFGDQAALKMLEGILHPPIRRLWQSQVEVWKAEGFGVAVVVIPLLFETGAVSNFDAVVCLACSTASQQERLRARGWNPEQIEQRKRSQWPVERKMDLANYVVWTEGSIQVHAEQLRRIITHRQAA